MRERERERERGSEISTRNVQKKKKQQEKEKKFLCKKSELLSKIIIFLFPSMKTPMTLVRL